MNGIGSLDPSSLLQPISTLTAHISVLMRIPVDSKCSNLSDALESVYTQSILPDQVVLVIVGTITDELEVVIASYQDDPRIHFMKIVSSSAEAGIAAALNAGLLQCSGDWIMCLDANSINHQDRLAIQLDYLAKYPDVDVLSSWCHELDDNGSRRIKSSAIHHAAIVNSLRWRNVIVYSSVLIRATTLRDIGGYRDHVLEAYDLYVRLALSGARFRAVPAELISVPTNRRGGLLDTWLEVRFRVSCWLVGFINFRQFLVITIAQSLFSLVSASIQDKLYHLVRMYPESSHAVFHSPSSKGNAAQCLAVTDWSSLPETTSASQ